MSNSSFSSPSYNTEVDAPTPEKTQIFINKELKNSLKNRTDMQENIDIPMDNKEAIAVVESMITSNTELSIKTWASKPLETLAVQHLLSHIGMFDKNRDGIYGPETKAAVLLLQKNIFRDFPEKQTGIFNTETAELLLEAVRPMDLSSEMNTIQKNTNRENINEQGISFPGATGESVIWENENGKKTTYYRNDTNGLYYTTKDIVITDGSDKKDMITKIVNKKISPVNTNTPKVVESNDTFNDIEEIKHEFKLLQSHYKTLQKVINFNPTIESLQTNLKSFYKNWTTFFNKLKPLTKKYEDNNADVTNMVNTLSAMQDTVLNEKNKIEKLLEEKQKTTNTQSKASSIHNIETEVDHLSSEADALLNKGNDLHSESDALFQKIDAQRSARQKQQNSQYQEAYNPTSTVHQQGLQNSNTVGKIVIQQ